MDAKTAGARLRAYRKRKGMVITIVADETGYSPNTISYFERGLHNPSLNLFLDLCAFYGVSPADVLNEKA